MTKDGTYEDKHLFALIAEGDETAFRQVFQRYATQLLPFLVRLTKSEAQSEEIVQEVFLRLWISRERLLEVENPHAWIFRIAANRAYTWLRKMAVEEEAIRSHNRSSRSEDNPVEETIAFREIRALVQEAIRKLPAQRRRIYTLHRNEGLKATEIATQLNISASTVKNALLAANKFIRDFVEKHGHGLAAVAWILLR